MNTLNRRINEKVKDKFPELNIEIRINERNIATVSGECETWEQLIDVGPVSYTHLDVYKRQEHGLGILTNRENECGAPSL